ncbi:MAG: acylphosphatase [Chlamydiales bacterium]|nr:acylphosphatase [Chlamydiales bacterium]
MLELHATFRGKVQGVGFRWTVAGYAELHGIAGTVKNLEDGDVEVYAVGPKEKLESFVTAIQNHSGVAEVKSVKTEYKEAERTYTNFEIIF